MAPLTYMERTMHCNLKKEGLDVPFQKNIKMDMMAGLDEPPLVSPPHGGPGITMCTFVHFLNLIWQPVLRYMENLFQGLTTTKSPEVHMNETSLNLEMNGVVPGPDEPLSMEEWSAFMRDYMLEHLGVEVPVDHIMNVVGTVVPLSLAPTRANAMHLLRSSVCSKFVGSSLSLQLSRKILAEVAELPVPLVPEKELHQQLKQEMVDRLARLHAPVECEESLEPNRKRSRTMDSRNEMLMDKTKQVLFMLQNRVAINRVHQTLMGALSLMKDLTSEAALENLNLEDSLLHMESLRRHMLLLDGALDRYMSDELYMKREKGTLAGVALATDESPPRQARFGGLRFQITVVYVGTFVPEAEWDNLADPPINSTSILGDIMHCPGKKGVDVNRVLEKQISRLGLNVHDVVTCTGDGGGENEGHQGVHAHLENLNPGYVRRRCLPHISWRTCDMALRASGLDYRALAAYLMEGVTWSRLRELATKAVPEGGLNLFRDGSQACKDLFGQRPCTIVTTRPETDMKFLEFLKGREHLLHRLATKDLEQRSLSTETQEAVRNLGDMKLRIQRMILAEILHRCLFLYYWSGRYTTVTERSSWDALLERGSCFILDLQISPELLGRWGITEARYAAMNPQPKTWVELVLQELLGDRDLVEDKLKEALDFHRSVTDQAAAHLNLVGNNTFRTPWLAAKILSKDPVFAQESAIQLLKHIATTRPSNRTSFEQHLIDNGELWQTLEDFSKADPPVALWQNRGRYRSLFKFLAPRFLISPDHVLDAERIHARWQWLLGLKRNLKLHSLNAVLRISHYLENNIQFPAIGGLVPHLIAERENHRMDMQALEREGEVALGWRFMGLYTDNI